MMSYMVVVVVVKVMVWPMGSWRWCVVVSVRVGMLVSGESRLAMRDVIRSFRLVAFQIPLSTLPLGALTMAQRLAHPISVPISVPLSLSFTPLHLAVESRQLLPRPHVHACRWPCPPIGL